MSSFSEFLTPLTGTPYVPLPELPENASEKVGEFLQDATKDLQRVLPDVGVVAQEVSTALQNPKETLVKTAKVVATHVNNAATEFVCATPEDRVAAKMEGVLLDSRVTETLKEKGLPLGPKGRIPGKTVIGWFKLLLQFGLRETKKFTNSEATTQLIERELDAYIDSEESWWDIRTFSEKAVEDFYQQGSDDDSSGPIVGVVHYVLFKLKALTSVVWTSPSLLLPSSASRFGSYASAALKVTTFVTVVPSLLATTLAALAWGGPLSIFGAVLSIASSVCFLLFSYQSGPNAWSVDSIRLILSMESLGKVHSWFKAYLPMWTAIAGMVAYFVSLYSQAKLVGRRYEYLDVLFSHTPEVTHQAQKEAQKVIKTYQESMDAWEPKTKDAAAAKWLFTNLYGRFFVPFTAKFAKWKAQIHLLPYVCLGRAQKLSSYQVGPSASNIIRIMHDLRVRLLEGLGIAVGLITGAFRKPFQGLSFLTSEPALRGFFIQFIDTIGKNAQQLHVDKAVPGFVKQLPPLDSPDRDALLSEISTKKLFKILVQAILYVVPQNSEDVPSQAQAEEEEPSDTEDSSQDGDFFDFMQDIQNVVVEILAKQNNSKKSSLDADDLWETFFSNILINGPIRFAGIPLNIALAVLLQYLLAHSHNILLHTTEEMNTSIENLLNNIPSVATSLGCSLSELLGLGTSQKNENLASLPDLTNIKPNHPASSKTKNPTLQRVPSRTGLQQFSSRHSLIKPLRAQWNLFYTQNKHLASPLIKIVILMAGTFLFGLSSFVVSLSFILFVPQILALPTLINTLVQTPLRVHLQKSENADALTTLENYTKSFEDPLFWFSEEVQTSLHNRLYSPQNSETYFRTEIGKTLATWIHKCSLAARNIGIALGFRPSKSEQTLCVEYGEQLIPHQQETTVLPSAERERLQNEAVTHHVYSAFSQRSPLQLLEIPTHINGLHVESYMGYTFRESGRFLWLLISQIFVGIGLFPLIRGSLKVAWTGKKFSVLKIPVLGNFLRECVETFLPHPHSLLFTGGLDLRAEDKHSNSNSQVAVLKKTYEEFQNVTLLNFLHKQACASWQESVLLLKKAHEFSNQHHLSHLAKAITIISSVSAALLLGCAKMVQAVFQKIDINIKTNLVRNTLKAQASRAKGDLQPLPEGWDNPDNFHGITADEFELDPPDAEFPFDVQGLTISEERAKDLPPGAEKADLSRAQASFWVILTRGSIALFVLSGILKLLAKWPETVCSWFTDTYTQTDEVASPQFTALKQHVTATIPTTKMLNLFSHLTNVIPGMHLITQLLFGATYYGATQLLFMGVSHIAGFVFSVIACYFTIGSIGFTYTASALGFSSLALLPGFVSGSILPIFSSMWSLTPAAIIPVILFVIKYLSSITVQEKVESTPTAAAS